MSGMPQRPQRDRDLDATIALAAVRDQHPALDCRRAQRLGEGWGTEAYLLDERLVARFPRTADAADWTDFEEAVLQLVTSFLSSEFSVPRLVGRGRPSASFPYDFLICDFVPGVQAGDPAAPHSEELAVDIGRALTSIHSVPLERARAAGLTEVEWDDSGYVGPLRFLHGDFRDDNLMVDPLTGRLIGVIDWGNAAVGDPALDFTTLVLRRGWDFMQRALASYSLSTDDQFLDRVRYHAQIQSLQWLLDSVRRRVDPEPHLSWVRNAFSLVPAS
jgi:aminoglycoside phosphotransferase (APT) family kinase protein